MSKSIAEQIVPRYFLTVSIAEKIFEKTQTLPEPTQAALLKLIESMETPKVSEKPKPQFGSAKGMIHIGPDFDEPLEDFQPYME